MCGDGVDCYSPEVMPYLCKEVASIREEGYSIAIVIGAGNILRGRDIRSLEMNRTRADHAGMTATVVNGIVLSNWLENAGLCSRVFSAFPVGQFVDVYEFREVRRVMDEGVVAILVGGTGNTHFSTDTASVLRSAELGVDVLLKATDVKGVYEGDPDKDKDAKLYDVITYREYLSRGLKVMDLTAISLAMEQNIPIMVYRFYDEGSMLGILNGEEIGTLIKG